MNAVEERVRLATSRSRQLRSESRSLHPVLARAYRRRACELDLEAFLHRVSSPDAGIDGDVAAVLTVEDALRRWMGDVVPRTASVPAA